MYVRDQKTPNNTRRLLTPLAWFDCLFDSRGRMQRKVRCTNSPANELMDSIIWMETDCQIKRCLIPKRLIPFFYGVFREPVFCIANFSLRATDVMHKLKFVVQRHGCTIWQIVVQKRHKLKFVVQGHKTQTKVCATKRGTQDTN